MIFYFNQEVQILSLKKMRKFRTFFFILKFKLEAFFEKLRSFFINKKNAKIVVLNSKKLIL